MLSTTRLRPFVSVGIGVLLLCTVAVRGATALPDGLLAWWSGDSNANDVSGNGHNATLAGNAVAGVPGLIGGAFQFDGTADFVSTPLLLPSQGTIDLWVKPADLTGDLYGIFGTFGLSNGNDRLWLNARGAQGGLGIGPNTLVVNIGNCCVNEIVVPSPLLKDTWTHVALTFDYVNDNYLDNVTLANLRLRKRRIAWAQAPSSLWEDPEFSETVRRNLPWHRATI